MILFELELSRKIFEKELRVSNFTKSRHWEQIFSMRRDSWRDGREEANSLSSQFSHSSSDFRESMYKMFGHNAAEHHSVN